MRGECRVCTREGHDWHPTALRPSETRCGDARPRRCARCGRREFLGMRTLPERYERQMSKRQRDAECARLNALVFPRG